MHLLIYSPTIKKKRERGKMAVIQIRGLFSMTDQDSKTVTSYDQS